MKPRRGGGSGWKEGSVCAWWGRAALAMHPAAQGATELAACPFAGKRGTGKVLPGAAARGQTAFRVMGLIFKRSIKLPRVFSEIC